MVPGEILGGNVTVCAEKLTGRLLERWGMHCKERAIPGLCIGEWCGVGVPGLVCEYVCD